MMGGRHRAERPSTPRALIIPMPWPSYLWASFRLRCRAASRRLGGRALRRLRPAPTPGPFAVAPLPPRQTARTPGRAPGWGPASRRWHPATLVVVPLLPVLALVMRGTQTEAVRAEQLGAAPLGGPDDSWHSPDVTPVDTHPRPTGGRVLDAVRMAVVVVPATPTREAAAPPARLPARPVRGRAEASGALLADGIPARALSAYVSATARTAVEDPACALPWTLLAAVGRVESDHGRAGGSVLGPDGVARPPLLGEAAAGSGAGVIPDTDGGRWDGDGAADLAVGPLQLLPWAWADYGDDSGSGREPDPQNIDDAALAAARYLCTVPTGAFGDLSTPAGQWLAAYGYNHATGFADLVLALSLSYASGRAEAVLEVPPVSGVPSIVDPGDEVEEAGAGDRAASAGATAVAVRTDRGGVVPAPRGASRMEAVGATALAAPTGQD